MARASITRRKFLSLTGASLSAKLLAQAPAGAHNLAEAERPRILAEADAALKLPLINVSEATPPHGAPHTFFSEVEPDQRTAGDRGAPTLFRTHARALRELSARLALLSTANLLNPADSYPSRAGELLRAALLAPDTALKPNFDLAGCAPGTETGTPMGIVDLVPLAELARALSFLTDTAALSEAEWDRTHAWFRETKEWLNNNRQALIARDTKDHRASAWLLIASAIARFNRDEVSLEACRKRFRTPTLRNQVRSDGVFPQEVATPNPYRNTLFNFDLLAGACQLLSSPFDPLWTYELIDGVGMRGVAAYLYPVIAHPERWSFVADAVDFRDLPGRRPGLLFAGRAYARPEYVEAWQRQAATPPPELLASSFPIQQPLLWTARAPHGL